MTAEQYLENYEDYYKIKESYPKLHDAIKEVMEGFAKLKCEELAAGKKLKKKYTMKIETKYQIGDIVYTMFDNKIVKRAVDKILIEVHYNKNVIIEYRFIEGKKYEQEVFSTKEELINSL